MVKKERIFSKFIIFGYIFLITLFDFSLCVSDWAIWAIYFSSNFYSNIFRAVLVFLIVGLCYLILKLKYFRHHAIGIALICSGLILDSIINYEKVKTEMNHALYILFMLSYSLFEALEDVLEKYVMEKKYVAPLLLLGLEGAIGVFIIGICFIFVGRIKCEIVIGLCELHKPIDDLGQGFKFLFTHYEYLILNFIRFIFLILYNVSRVLTNYHYTPAHRIIPKTFRRFLAWALVFIPNFPQSGEPKKAKQILGEFFAHFLQMFGVLLFVEVLIIGVFNINKYIVSEIIRREIDEYENRIDRLVPSDTKKGDDENDNDEEG